MFFYLTSTDNNDYATVRFSANPPLGTGQLRFRVRQLSTVASFMITTEDDYIKVMKGGKQYELHFLNKNKYDRDMLVADVTNIISHAGLTCTENDFGTLTLRAAEEFTISDASHRVRLLLGMYHTQLPITSAPITSAPITSEEDNQDGGIVSALRLESVPYLCYGNNLYLRSSISSVACLNDSLNRESYQSICYHVNEVFISGLPITSKLPGPYSAIMLSDLSHLEFSLVDFQNVPVVLKAPLNIELEVSF